MISITSSSSIFPFPFPFPPPFLDGADCVPLGSGGGGMSFESSSFVGLTRAGALLPLALAPPLELEGGSTLANDSVGWN